MKVREIMTTDVECAAPDSTLDEVAQMMRDEDTGAIPVLDDDELCGIITDRDIVVRCIAEGNDPSEITAEEIVSDKLCTIEPNADIEQAARIMAEQQIRRLPVVENGKLVGMLSLGDVAVKQADESMAGSTLEDVSEGVKATKAGQRGGQPQRQKARVEPPHTPGVVGGGRQEQLEGHAGRKAGRSEGRAQPARALVERERGDIDRSISTEKPQGIANRDVREEQQRQARVVPIRGDSENRGEQKGGRGSKRKTG